MANESIFHKNAFDAIRLMAALQVMFGHMYRHYELGQVSSLFEPMYVFSQYIPGRGVPIFFAISGFLALHSIETARNKKEYFKKKILRIYPEMILCFIVSSMIIIGFFNVRAGGALDYVIYVFTQLTVFQYYTGDWMRGYGVGSPNGVLGSLVVIIQFYILAYFTRPCFFIRDKKVWVGRWGVLAFVSIAISNSKGYLPEILYKLLCCSIVAHAHIFFTGIFCYVFFDEIVEWLKTRWAIFLCLYILSRYAVLLLIHNTGWGLGVDYDVVSSLCLTLAIIGAAYRMGCITIKPELSYGLFLWHMIVVNVGVEWIRACDLHGMEILALAFVTFVSSAALAYISHDVTGRLLRVGTQWKTRRQCVRLNARNNSGRRYG